MTRKALMVSVALASLAVAAPAIGKGKSVLYQLPMVTGSTETIAFGINNKHAITGFWLDSSGVEHGFVGPDDGSNYTSFDAPTDPDTQARGISQKGYITGIDNVLSGDPTTYIPFERSPDGTITDVTKNGTTLNYLVQGINKMNFFTGNYENSSAQFIGYTGKNAQYGKAIKLKGITNTGVAGRGINDNGDIVGWYLDSGGLQHGFLLPKGGQAVTIDNPGGTTNPEGINNKGEISGLYTDSSGNRHGFIYNIAKAKFTELTVPGSTFVEVWGLNDDGVVAIDGENSSAVFVGYLYCPTAKVCPSGGAARSSEVPVLHHVPRPAPLVP
jgi:hypothetical protein